MCESVIELRRTVDEDVDVAVVAELIASPGAEEIERARPKRADELLPRPDVPRPDAGDDVVSAHALSIGASWLAAEVERRRGDGPFALAGCRLGPPNRRDSLQAPGRERGRAVGRIFVLAAHAIETPRLLLASNSPAAANGVANGSGQVGRNLIGHATQLSWALAAE